MSVAHTWRARRHTAAIATVAAACLVAVGATVATVVVSGGSAVSARLLATIASPRSNVAMDRLTWVPGARMLVVRADMGVAPHSSFLFSRKLSSVRPLGSWVALRPTTSSTCPSPGFFYVSPAASGPRTFAFVQGCARTLLTHPESSKRVREYRLPSGETRALVPYGVSLATGAISVRRRSPRVVLNDGNGLFERLQLAGSTRLSRRYSLGQDRLGGPAWSPDGRTIAVPGSSNLAGQGGPERAFNARWRILLANERLTSYRPLGKTTYRERPDLAWSPNGKLLAVSSQTAEADGQLSIVRVSDGKVFHVAAGILGDVTWTSATTVAVIRSTSYVAEQPKTWVDLWDVTEIVKKAISS